MAYQALVIEKGIPCPPKKNAGGLLSFLKAMEVGDSMFLAGKKNGQLSAYLVLAKPAKFTGRTVAGGLRVWRIA